MSKYSNEFKLEVVNYYLNDKTSYPETARHFSMTDWTSIQKWVRKYMHKNHLSLKETSYHFNLGNLNVVKQ